MQLLKSKNGKAEDKNGRNGKSVLPMERLYRPTDKEPFMNERQREYFRLKLLDWREDILKEAKETLQHLQDESQNHPDLADRASSETDRAIELRARDRQRKLISKIDAALARIEDGTYGYCEETGEPISIKRLEARPIATLSIEAQERHERRERVYRDSLVCFRCVRRQTIKFFCSTARNASCTRCNAAQRAGVDCSKNFAFAFNRSPAV